MEVMDYGYDDIHFFSLFSMQKSLKHNTVVMHVAIVVTGNWPNIREVDNCKLSLGLIVSSCLSVVRTWMPIPYEVAIIMHVLIIFYSWLS